jgi:tetratricopeptide (TPR) repeat protein
MKLSSERSGLLRELRGRGYASLSAIAARQRRRIPCSLGFVGRSQDLVRAAGASHRSRLVTIVAPGGIGKTRLAVELTRGRVPVCNLACVHTAPQLLDALRGTLGLRLPGAIREGAGQVETLASHLPYRLILDNAEGLDASAVDLAGRLFQLAPHCRILVTSRRALELPGEAVIALAPLSPSASKRLARRLAQAFGKGVAQVDIDAAQGSPLALEIAASGSTMETLPPRLKSVLCALSVFAHSWSESEGRQVTAFDELDIEQLLDSRLIHRLPESGRYSMLPPVRDAARKLEASEPEIIHRHTALFEEIARSGEGILDIHEHELVAAMDRLQAQGEYERAARMAVALTPWACSSGRIDTSLGWLRVAEATTLPARLEAEVADALGRTLLSAGKFEECAAPLHWAMGFWETEGNLSLAGRAATNLGVSHQRRSDLPIALGFVTKAVDFLRPAGDAPRLTVALTNLGQILGELGQFTQAAHAQQEAIHLSGTQQNLARRYLNLAEAYLNAGDTEETMRAIRSVDALTSDPHEVARATVMWEMATGGTRKSLAEALEKSRALGIVSSFWPQTLALITARLGETPLPD